MQKAIIFGAGDIGQRNLAKLKYVYDVVAFCDNNRDLWNQRICGIPVIPPDKLPDAGALVFICINWHWREAAQQLDALGVRYIVLDSYLSYRITDNRMYPVDPAKPAPYKKTKPDEFSVLFVQQILCARTEKIAAALRDIGVTTCAAFQLSPSKMNDAFCTQVPIFSFASLIEYVNESEFDIVHSSNEDDTLTNLLLHSNKKVVFDCHDLISEAYIYNDYEKFPLEYIACTMSDGVMIFSEPAKEVLCEKYNLRADKVLAVENYPLESFKPAAKLRKLSKDDGQIHCVYEGGLFFEQNAFTAKNFRDYFLRFCEAGIHIHFYSNANASDCEALAEEHPLMHYEGNIRGIDLITQMQKYDLGFCIYNLTEGPMDSYLRICSPNKLFEYLSAGLPVITNVKPFAKFATKNECGAYIDTDGDIKSQCEAALKNEISGNFISDKGLTMNANINRILKFYKSIIDS